MKAILIPYSLFLIFYSLFLILTHYAFRHRLELQGAIKGDNRQVLRRKRDQKKIKN